MLEAEQRRKQDEEAKQRQLLQAVSQSTATLRLSRTFS